MSKNFGEKWLTGAVCFDVSKAFNTALFDGLLYKLSLIFASYLVKTLSSYPIVGRSKRPSKQPHPLVVLCGLA
jgi:hypothetical protein